MRRKDSFSIDLLLLNWNNVVIKHVKYQSLSVNTSKEKKTLLTYSNSFKCSSYSDIFLFLHKTDFRVRKDLWLLNVI